MWASAVVFFAIVVICGGEDAQIHAAPAGDVDGVVPELSHRHQVVPVEDDHELVESWWDPLTWGDSPTPAPTSLSAEDAEIKVKQERAGAWEKTYKAEERASKALDVEQDKKEAKYKVSETRKKKEQKVKAAEHKVKASLKEAKAKKTVGTKPEVKHKNHVKAKLFKQLQSAEKQIKIKSDAENETETKKVKEVKSKGVQSKKKALKSKLQAKEKKIKMKKQKKEKKIKRKQQKELSTKEAVKSAEAASKEAKMKATEKMWKTNENAAKSLNGQHATHYKHLSAHKEKKKEDKELKKEADEADAEKAATIQAAKQHHPIKAPIHCSRDKKTGVFKSKECQEKKDEQATEDAIRLAKTQAKELTFKAAQKAVEKAEVKTRRRRRHQVRAMGSARGSGAAAPPTPKPFSHYKKNMGHYKHQMKRLTDEEKTVKNGFSTATAGLFTPLFTTGSAAD